MNLFIKRAFWKSRDHFGTQMPMYMSIIEIKVRPKNLFIEAKNALKIILSKQSLYYNKVLDFILVEFCEKM